MGKRVEGREWCDGGQECIKRPLLIPSHPSLMPPHPPPSLLGSAAPPLHFLSCPSRPIRPLFPPPSLPFLFPRSLPSSPLLPTTPHSLPLPLNIVRPSPQADLAHPRYIFQKLSSSLSSWLPVSLSPCSGWHYIMLQSNLISIFCVNFYERVTNCPL